MLIGLQGDQESSVSLLMVYEGEVSSDLRESTKPYNYSRWYEPSLVLEDGVVGVRVLSLHGLCLSLSSRVRVSC